MLSEKISNAIEFVTSFKSERYPVDLENICDILGIKVNCQKELDNDGYLICQQGKKIILVNSRIRNRHRQKYIIAHELGHFMLHREILYSCKNIFECNYQSVNSKTQEKEANVFATELLIPHSEICAHIPKERIELQNIFSIASIFDVSVTHAAMQAVKASNTESEVLICYDNHRLKWFVSANPTTYTHMIPSFAPDHLDSSKLETDIIGGWTDLYEGTVHQEIFNPYGTQQLILLSGRRKD